MEIPDDKELQKFDFISFLGKGSFGKVFQGQYKGTNQQCAIKILLKNKWRQEKRFLDEALLLSRLNHPNIIKFNEVKTNFNNCFSIDYRNLKEHLSSGSLHQIIHEQKVVFNDLQASQAIKHILFGVQYLHSNNIIHRDLKLANILLENNKNFETIKIADFGLSIQITYEQVTSQLTQQVGTLIYMPPEFVNEGQYGKAMDLWCIGIMAYKLLHQGLHPIYKPNDTKQSYKEKLKNFTWEFSSKISHLAVDFCKRLTERLPSQRYTAEIALKHPWITRKFNEFIPLNLAEEQNCCIKNPEF